MAGHRCGRRLWPHWWEAFLALTGVETAFAIASFAVGDWCAGLSGAVAVVCAIPTTIFQHFAALIVQAIVLATAIAVNTTGLVVGYGSFSVSRNNSSLLAVAICQIVCLTAWLAVALALSILVGRSELWARSAAKDTAQIRVNTPGEHEAAVGNVKSGAPDAAAGEMIVVSVTAATDDEHEEEDEEEDMGLEPENEEQQVVEAAAPEECGESEEEEEDADTEEDEDVEEVDLSADPVELEPKEFAVVVDDDPAPLSPPVSPNSEFDQRDLEAEAAAAQLAALTAAFSPPGFDRRLSNAGNYYEQTGVENDMEQFGHAASPDAGYGSSDREGAPPRGGNFYEQSLMTAPQNFPPESPEAYRQIDRVGVSRGVNGYDVPGGEVGYSAAMAVAGSSPAAAGGEGEQETELMQLPNPNNHVRDHSLCLSRSARSGGSNNTARGSKANYYEASTAAKGDDEEGVIPVASIGRRDGSHSRRELDPQSTVPHDQSGDGAEDFLDSTTIEIPPDAIELQPALSMEEARVTEEEFISGLLGRQ
eukprot:GHVU01073558.1.p1 GENE.GHVU01073558.1~~GHVU01073558.1.p1  ORF type:complete len:534 (+),score=84.50 GHVU01073558.1:318-1919(+)